MSLICQLTCICAVLCIVQASAKDLDSHLVAHYEFNGDFSDRSNNQFGGDNHGVTFCSDRFNEKDAAASFDGVNDFIRIPVNINPRNHPQLTICAWVRLSDVEQKGVLVSHDNGGFDRTLILDARGDNNGDFEWSAFPLRNDEPLTSDLAFQKSDTNFGQEHEVMPQGQGRPKN